MRTVLLVFFLLININLMAQTHIEYISEKADSMALINKKDIDIINNVFNKKRTLDSLHNLNEQIISNLEQEVKIQDSVIVMQLQTIENDKLLVEKLEYENNQTIAAYSKELKSEKNKKISFQTLTGIGIIAIILLILL